MGHGTIPAIVALIAFNAVVSDISAADRDLAHQIKALKKERVETLTKLDAYCKAEFAAGAIRCEAVIDAENDLIRAELDATEKPEERIALLTDHVKDQTDFLKTVEYRRQTVTIGLANVYRTRAMLQSTKIMLLQEQQKRGAK